MKNKIKRFIIDVCETIITWLDPVRVKECRLSTEEVSMSLKGYLRKRKWVHASFSVEAWMKNCEDKKSSITEVTLHINGAEKKKTLTHLPLREGVGSTV
jgi:hypothetical protein